jgi:hypothetical protein
LHAPGPLHRDASFTPAAYFEPLLPPLDEPPVEPPMLEPLLPVEPPDEPPVVLVSLLPDEPLMPEPLLPEPLLPEPELPEPDVPLLPELEPLFLVDVLPEVPDEPAPPEPDEPLMPEALLSDEPLEPAPLPLELPLLCANAEPASIAAETSIAIDNFFILCSLISCQ